MDPNNQLSLASYQFKTSQDLVVMASQPAVQQKVTELEKSFYTINIEQTMGYLSQVGGLLQLAYAGTKGHKSCVKVTGILSDYQALIKNSQIANRKFVLGCLTSVKNHQSALNMAEKKKYESAISYLVECGNQAAEMAELADKLINESQALCSMSKEALLLAVEDENTSTDQRERITKEIHDLQAKEAALKSKTMDLARQVEEEKIKEKALCTKAEKAQAQAFAIGMVSAVMKPLGQIAGSILPIVTPITSTAGFIGTQIIQALTQAQSTESRLDKELTELKSQIKKKSDLIAEEKLKGEKGDVALIASLEKEEKDLNTKLDALLNSSQAAKAALKEVQEEFQKNADNFHSLEQKAAERRVEAQKAQMEANAQLAESIERLKGFNVEKNDLNKSIASLEIAVKTLGKIKTVFENTRVFWNEVEMQCKTLSDISTMKILLKEEEHQEFSKNLLESAWSWIVLGKINYSALQSIGLVQEKVDVIMSNLPNAEEKKQLIEVKSDLLLLQIKGENDLLTGKHS